MSRRDPKVRLLHMRDFARKAVELARGKTQDDLVKDEVLRLALTHVQATIGNPAAPQRRTRLLFLVDSGAVYSVVPARVLRKLGIKPRRTRTFILAEGTAVKRFLWQALFRSNGEEGASPVIFGDEDDSVLLGAVSLEALGLLLDPLKRELRPLPTLLAPHSPAPRRGDTAARACL